MNTLIRPSFIAECNAFSKEGWRKSWSLIEARDTKHRDLNRRYGHVEPDGSVPIGCRSHVDHVYKAEYDRIEIEFKRIYDGIPVAFDNWKKSNAITIFEYLLLDNLSGDQLQYVCDNIKSGNEPIEIKARCFIQNWKEKYTVGGIKSAIDSEISNHAYASARCRKFFSIKPWNVNQNISIINYSRQWKSALDKNFLRLEAA